MTIIEELNKACSETAEVATGLLKKSQMAFDFSAPAPGPNPHAHDHHAAYTRTNASGTVSQIQAKGYNNTKISIGDKVQGIHTPTIHTVKDIHQDGVITVQNPATGVTDRQRSNFFYPVNVIQPAPAPQHKEGDYVRIKDGFGAGKVFKVEGVSNGRVRGEITHKASFYPVNLKHEEVEAAENPNGSEKRPEDKSAHEVLEAAGLKHRLGQGYKPELDPYQNHYGSITHSEIHQHLSDAGYHYTKKGTDNGKDWHSYERSVPYAKDRITLTGNGNHITSATRYAGPDRD